MLTSRFQPKVLLAACLGVVRLGYAGLLLLLLISTDLVQATQIPEQTRPANLDQNTLLTTPEVYITVFTHGTIHPHVNLQDFNLVLEDRIDHSHYYYVNEWHRQDPIYFKTQAMQGEGLQPIELDPLSKPKSNGATALANIYEYFSLKNHPNRQSYYYTFGWSGLLSATKRLEAAAEFHQSLKELLAKFRAQGLTPKLRLVGFSHGGTITLDLGLFEPDDATQIEVPVTELVLLGTPVQKETECLVDHPMFQRVFHFYSRGDFPQTSDYISTDHWFCHWRFIAHDFCLFRGPGEHFKLPEKLTQIELNIDLHGQIMQPKHTELWTFAWMQKSYRQKFPLNPVPVAAVMPAVISLIERHVPRSTTELVATIKACEGELQLRELYQNLRTKEEPFAVPFLSRGDRQAILAIAERYEPAPQTRQKVRRSAVRAARYAVRKRAEHKSQICLLDRAREPQRIPDFPKRSGQRHT